jgi:hypothetical protein
MTSSAWQIDRQRARLQLAQLAATIDLSQPAQGLVALRVGSDCLEPAGLLGIELPSLAASGARLLTECRVRGLCLAAAYKHSEDWPVRVEAAWRAEGASTSADGASTANAPLATIEVVVSVETQRLDSRPELAVASVLPTADVSRLVDARTFRFETVAGELPCAIERDGRPGCLLFRLPGSDISYAEMVHPLDFLGDRLEASAESVPTVRLRHRLFGGRLEKGVILRARVRGVFLPRQRDTRIAAELYSSFAAAELLLGA